MVSNDASLVPDVMRVVSDDRMLVPDGTILQWLLTRKRTLVPNGTGCVSDGTVDAAEKKFSLFDVLFIFRMILFLFRYIFTFPYI